MKIYTVELIAQSFSFYYESKEEVYASSIEEAEEKAVNRMSKRTLISKQLIRVVKSKF